MQYLGYLGTFTLSLHWMNLGNQPVEILIEDIYLLVVPSPQTGVDPEEEEQRAQAAKAERLENAELLHMGGQAEVSSGKSSQPAASRLSQLKMPYRGFPTVERIVGVFNGKDYQQSSDYGQKYPHPIRR
jgi:hypothetical protein